VSENIPDFQRTYICNVIAHITLTHIQPFYGQYTGLPVSPPPQLRTGGFC